MTSSLPSAETKTICEKWSLDGTKLLRRYVLKHDERGYYFDGLREESYRRVNRKTVEDYARSRGFDVLETEV